jgi:hypothetical protein
MIDSNSSGVVLEGQFNDLPSLHRLLLESSNEIIGRIGNIFDLRETHQWIDHREQDLEESR